MTSPGLSMVLKHSNQFGQAYARAFLTAVPEPTAATSLLTIGALGMGARRRRRLHSRKLSFAT